MDTHFKNGTLIFALFIAIICIGSCKSSGGGLIGPEDETAKAGEVVREANNDLKQIKKLYEDNENKREELKKALSSDNEAEVRRLTKDLVDAIAEGTSLGRSAMEKLDQAREMKVNDDYATYLKLKSDTLKLQLQAFDEYRQAAKQLHDEYDPKNTQVRDAVKADFKERSDNFQKLMERARDYSTEAKDFAKEVQQKESNQ